MLRILFSCLVFCIALIPATHVQASPSVGIGIGKITLEIPLEPKSITLLEPIVIYNDGDEPAVYELEVMFNETQSEHKPKKEWFSYSAQNFELLPGESKTVDVTLTLPDDAKTGDYFSYIEARAIQHAIRNDMATTVSTASAAKLTFSVSRPVELVQEVVPEPLVTKTTLNSQLQFNHKKDSPVIPSLTFSKLLFTSPIM